MSYPKRNQDWFETRHSELLTHIKNGATIRKAAEIVGISERRAKTILHRAGYKRVLVKVRSDGSIEQFDSWGE